MLFKRLLSVSLAIASLVAFTTACDKKKTEPNEEATGFVAEKREAGIKVVYPDKISGQLNNPGMGWVILEEPTYDGHMDLGYSGDFPEVDNISLSTSWANIETSENIYDWSLIDKTIDYWTQKGKMINFRICTDSLVLPYTYQGVPEYLFTKYKLKYREDTDDTRPYKLVDLSDTNYQTRLKLFLSKLAERYGDNPDVDIIEIRGYGKWGEWHSGYSYDSYENRISILREVVSEWDQAWQGKSKVLVVSASAEYREDITPYVANPDDYSDFLKWSAFDYSMNQADVTFRRDGAGGCLKYATEQKLFQDFIRSGKRLPLFAEFYSNYDACKNSSNGFNLEEALNDMMFKLRPNYCSVLGWVSSVTKDVAKNDHWFFDRGNEMMGYRLVINKAEYPAQAAQGSTFEIKTEWANMALGRFWYKDLLKIYFVDESGKDVYAYTDENYDARAFINGEIYENYSQVNLPSDMKEGTYTIMAAVVDRTTGEPAIRLGIAGDDGSKRYELGTVAVKSDVKQADLSTATDGSQIDSIQLKALTTYRLSFDYLPSFNVQNFKFGTDDGYFVNLVAEGEKEKLLQWQDVSGEKGSRTVIFKTPDTQNLKLEAGSDNFGELKLSNIRVTEVAAFTEDFENYQFDDQSALKASGTVTLSSQKSSLIDGSKSVECKIKKKDRVDAVTTNSDVLTFKPYTVYTIAFDFRAVSDVGNGGYYYLNLASKTQNKNTEIAEWYQRPDYPSQKYAYTFKTGDAADYTVSMGVFNGATFSFDNLIIIEQSQGSDVVADKTQKVEVNQAREIVKTLPAEEGFESGAFSGTIFGMGANNWGRLTSSKNEVINGKYSLLSRMPTNEEWFEFAHSRPSSLKLESNKSYRVSFNYKVLKDLANPEGYFYTLARTAKGDYSDDKGFTSWKASAGDFGHKVIDITTGEKEEYYIVFGMRWGGEITIDDVKVEQLPDASAFQGSINFENGSITLSNCLTSTVNGSAGDLVSRDDLVISGKYSILGENKTGSQWYDFLYTDPTKVKILPNTTYTLSFKYKVIKETSGENFFQAFARSDIGGVSNDTGTKTFMDDAGTVGEVSTTFTTKNFEDYKLAFGMKGSGAVVIDDIKLVKN
jgi:hypothetical protein